MLINSFKTPIYQKEVKLPGELAEREKNEGTYVLSSARKANQIEEKTKTPWDVVTSPGFH